MISPVFIENCSLPPVSVKEILRYSGVAKPSNETDKLLRECLAECKDIFSERVAYRVFSITRENKMLCIGNMRIESKDLEKNLRQCDSVILMVASAGLKIDRLIEKYKSLSPAKALMLHSIGTERVEALCDTFCKKIQHEQGFAFTPRFSPGYGDLPLDYQKEILALLNTNQTIGVYLNESLLLSPSKSVTAFVGIKKSESK
ncbi:MAG: Vitamin B12 dependent methionine synthase activation subunit [Ruminococcaceae bacterium]|nr:Vitamin B12 dependent methionine synthase activation subunit [Oscillospiraceae bacterium]